MVDVSDSAGEGTCSASGPACSSSSSASSIGDERGSGRDEPQSDDDVQRRQVERLLDVLGDPYLNKHLVFGLIELVVVRLLPELGEKGVDALMEERLGYNL